MSKVTIPPHWIYLILSCSVVSGGCSLIGFGIGTVNDGGSPGPPLISPADLDSLPPGTRMSVARKDLSEITGTYEGKGWVEDTLYPEREYPKAFETWRREMQSNASWIPAFGASVQVLVRGIQGEKIYRGSFAGFDSGVVRMNLHSQTEVIGLKVSFVGAFMDSLGRTLATQEELINTLERGVPYVNRLMMKPGIILESRSFVLGSSLSNIAMEDIAEMNGLGPGNAKWAGLAIGVAIDVTVLWLGWSSTGLGIHIGGSIF